MNDFQNMINRPRCRDWSPLATQQLRLRNLIQITGHNIETDANTSIYFTLHMTLMSAPFFTSERIESYRNAIWAEINCQSIHKSTSQFVVVRVWRSYRSRTDETSRRLSHSDQLHRESARNDEISIANGERNSSSANDRVLFVWGVYFSGLVPITKRSDVKLADNALIFYIHGGFFTSAAYLLPESVPKQYEYFYRTDQRYLNLYSSTKGTSNTTTTTKNCDSYNSNRIFLIEPSSVERKCDSPIKRSESGRLSPSCDVIASYRHKDDSISEALENSSDEVFVFSDPNILKVRYLDKEFFKLEIRPSYNVKKLLLLQEKQRIFRKRTISANEMIEKICMRSASCLNLQLIANKGMLYRPRGNPSIGRTLNRLLATQIEQPKPEDLLRAQELRRQIEMAKFRCRFLNMERDRYKVILRKLHDKCNKLSDENIEKESWLMDDYRELSRNRDIAAEQKSLYLHKRNIYENAREMLVKRQQQLLMELKEIYEIKKCPYNDYYEINGICLPNTDALRTYYTPNTPGTSNPALSLSVAMCYVAHVVMLCSSVLNIPLRNRIIYQGSASKIRDDVKPLSEHDREFPLYCRNIPISDSLLYAAFLLNQNISQIKFTLNIHSAREDIRGTLPNLLAILSVAEQTASRSYAIQPSVSSSLLAVDTSDPPMSSVSETSIDIMISVPAQKIHSISEENISKRTIRPNIGLSKTHGSFSDDQLTARRDKFSSNRGATTSNTSTSNKKSTSEPILSTGHIS